MPSAAVELAASVVQPHFDAVRDVFLEHTPAPGETLGMLARTRFEIDTEIHDSRRHFAATRDDGLLMMFAPGIVDLDLETLAAILAHEFGHATDFLYPARWLTPMDGPGKAAWIPVGTPPKLSARWSKLWKDRTRDQVEWAADGIGEAVTGKPIRYCGNLLLQCFTGTKERPRWLR
jgi:hypothetical protein